MNMVLESHKQYNVMRIGCPRIVCDIPTRDTPTPIWLDRSKKISISIGDEGRVLVSVVSVTVSLTKSLKILNFQTIYFSKLKNIM